ncbi:MAG: biopolymer transporter ExbB [Alphaproteobacteria bacterium]|nr:MAG: biopolymer transporter ExbB [Alphaproteobacteria bacterium]
MDEPERAAEPRFTQPWRQIFLILVVLGLVAAGLTVALPKVLPVFLSNLYLNGFIALVFVIGLFATIFQVVQIGFAVRWVKGYVAGRPGHDADHPPRLLAPMAGMLRGRAAKMQISPTSARSILDSVAERIDEQRDLTRYLTNLLIFLGLLGTFFGLATTVPAVVDTIKSLAPSEGEGGVDVYNRLLTGLESQLGGMGTAFSSSLLGLAGSLVVGLVELFATHGQNRFYRELEEWMSSITRIGFAPGDHEAPTEASGPSAWLAHMSEQMEALQQMFTQSDVSRALVDERLGQLADAVERLSRQIEAEGVSTPYLIRMAEGQERLIELLENRVGGEGGGHVDAESRMRLRSIDVQLLRILEEISAGRQESMTELRAEIAALTRAVRQLGGGRG